MNATALESREAFEDSFRSVLERSEDHGEPTTVHACGAFDADGVAERIDDLVERYDGPVPVGVFAPPEEHGELHLVSGIEETLGPIHLDEPIVVIRLRPESHLLEYVLSAVRFPLPLSLDVLELPVVHDPAHRRTIVGRHLDEVHPDFTSQSKRLGRRKEASLLTVLVDQPDLRDPNLLVGAM